MTAPKRPRNDSQSVLLTPPKNCDARDSSPIHIMTPDALTPAPSSPVDSPSTEPPRKKVKLSDDKLMTAKAKTQLERDEKRAAKEAEQATKKRAREAEKAARLAEKEAEKAAKSAEREAERAAKQAEKEAEKSARQAERAAKLAEKEARDEEKRKLKEDEQRRKDGLKQKENKQMRLNQFFKMPAEDSHTPETPESDYDKIFLPFCPGTHVTVAPVNRFTSRTTQFDLPSTEARQDPLFSSSRRRGRKCQTVQSIMENTGDKNTQLQNIQYKFLGFCEDVRPPYMGSYTKQPVSGTLRLMRNPFLRDLPDKDYDYDSEPEWQEPEEGEDIASDGEDEEDGVDDSGDLDGFLDDADDHLTNMKRIIMHGDLQPENTGLCWEDVQRSTQLPNSKKYRMEIFQEISQPIDPFSAQYWAQSRMDPRPLQLTKMTSSKMNRQSTPKLIPAEDMEAFKQAVAGSDLSKAGLIEVLYKKFPKHGKAAVKDTLEAVAQRIGSKLAEKRWVLKG